MQFGIPTCRPRAEWISTLLLEWLQKQCNHPAQGHASRQECRGKRLRGVVIVECTSEFTLPRRNECRL